MYIYLFLSYRPRFGLFSQPVSTAIGDTNTYKKLIPKRDEDGTVMMGPKNFYTTKGKAGKAEDVYFQKTDFICRGDPFKQAAMQSMRTEVKDGWEKAGHEKNFKPAKNTNEKLFKMPFPYREQGLDKKDPKEYRDEDGNVITAPTNFYTNPMKKGRVGKSVSFNKFQYMDGDKYDIARTLAKQEREYHMTKIQEKQFSQRAKHTDTFNTHKQILEENPPIAERKKKEEQEREDIHEGKAFKPANPGKRGKNGTLERFPLHKADPPKEKKYVKPADDAPEVPPGFKATYKYRSRPTPSVATNMRNLKASFPSAFRSPVR